MVESFLLLLVEWVETSSAIEVMVMLVGVCNAVDEFGCVYFLQSGELMEGSSVGSPVYDVEDVESLL
jgi:hypothetical protein